MSCYKTLFLYYSNEVGINVYDYISDKWNN